MSKSTRLPQVGKPTFVVYLKIALNIIFELLLLTAIFAVMVIFLVFG